MSRLFPTLLRSLGQVSFLVRARTTATGVKVFRGVMSVECCLEGHVLLSLCFMLCSLDPVLLDLPLPTHVPTPTEHSLLFSATLKDESSQLLQNTNKDVVRNIVSVIERVKMDYL